MLDKLLGFNRQQRMFLILGVFLGVTLSVVWLVTVASRPPDYVFFKTAGSLSTEQAVFDVVEDTYVSDKFSDRSFGDRNHVLSQDNPHDIAYLKFETLTLPAESTIESAKIVLAPSQGRDVNQSVYVSSSEWDEDNMNWNNKIVNIGTKVGSIKGKRLSSSEIIEISIPTSTIESFLGESVTVVVEGSGVLRIDSKESGAAGAKLVVSYSVVTPEPAPDEVVIIEPVPPEEEPTTSPPITSPPTSSTSIWLSPEEAANLQTSGSAWEGILSHASRDTTNPDFKDQDSKVDVYTMAKALAYAKTGNESYRSEVRDTLKILVDTHPISESTSWDWLGILRGLGGFVIAADTINLPEYDPTFDTESFRPWLDKVRFAITEGSRGSVVSAHEIRPNNFGTHAAASRIAADLYLGDQADLDKAIKVFRGQLGDRSYYSNEATPGFKFGALDWQCDQSKPVPINPLGCKIEGHDLDGAQPEERRRHSGSAEYFVWPPIKVGYDWEGIQGLVTAAELLHRAGYPSYEWSDKAILRSVDWLYTTTFDDGTTYPAEGDDNWIPWIINYRYGTNLPTESPTRPGKMIGYTDWTHSK